MRWSVLSVFLGMAGMAGVAHGDGLSYFGPGDILPAHVDGNADRRVLFPDWVFPVEAGRDIGRHAYMGTQLPKYHGLDWANDPRLYRYPHRDNQCEPRRWKMHVCAAGQGHQGQDIRPHDNSDARWAVRAVEEGVVVLVTGNTTVAVRSENRTCRYLHMDKASIAAANITLGAKVRKGQVLGKVSNLMKGVPNTSIHLHFDCYTGTAASGNFYPVYASLLAAYLRAWEVDPVIKDGKLSVNPDLEIGAGGTPPETGQPIRPAPGPAPADCAGVTLGPTPPGVDLARVRSLWRHNCSVMGLISGPDSDSRRFVYVRPKSTIAPAIASEPLLFEGRAAGGAYRGRARSYSSRCGDTTFEVSGMAGQVSGTPVVTLEGQRPRRNAGCKVTGAVGERLVFRYVGRADFPLAPFEPAPDRKRKTLSERSRNFLAITFYPDVSGTITMLPYVAAFPGLSPRPGPLDSKGGLIPRLHTDEAGVALSWVWLKRRARYLDGMVATPRAIIHSMAGVDPTVCDAQLVPTDAAREAMGAEAAATACAAVLAYGRGYLGLANGRGFARETFGREIGIDEMLNFEDPETAWRWMAAMYSHESGRAPVIDRETFDRGKVMGEDWIAAHYGGASERMRPVAFYSAACNFAPAGCDGDTDEDLSETDTDSSEKALAELEALRGLLQEAQNRLDEFSESLGEE